MPRGKRPFYNPAARAWLDTLDKLEQTYLGNVVWLAKWCSGYCGRLLNARPILSATLDCAPVCCPVVLNMNTIKLYRLE